MKKITLILLGLLISSTSVFAQLDLGVMNGIHITNANYEPNKPFSKTYFAIP